MKRVVYSIVFAVFVYLGLSFFAGFDALYAAARQFDWWYLPPILVLAFSNYLIRFIKWQYYLRVLRLKVKRQESFIIFMAGLALAITPGKMGEVIRSYFLKVRYGYALAKTAPIVLADRLSDLIAMVILAAVGAAGFHHGQKIIWSTTVVVLLIVAVIVIRPLGQRVINFFKGWRLLQSKAAGLQELYDSSYSLLRPSRLVWPTVVAIIAWGCEATAFYLVFLGLGVQAGVLAAFFIYSFSMIVGAVAMLPGGLGITEGSITGLLRLLAVPAGVATLATVIIRAATLWFAILLGTVFLVKAERIFAVDNFSEE